MSRLQKTCEECGEPFYRNRHYSRKQWAAAKYCSQTCSGLAASARQAIALTPLRDRFDLKYVRSAGCWEWTGTIEGYGYGVIDHGGRRYRAHVLSLEFDGRPVPKGMVACHRCDNPRCVRPDHLYVGTAQDNANDAVARGRLRVGEGNRMSKLTATAVLEMRRLYKSGGGNYAQIARRFGVSRPTATRAITGETWGHI